jgi:hypothetical protein
MLEEHPMSDNASIEQAQSWLGALFAPRASTVLVDPDYYREFFANSEPIHPEDLLRFL